MLKTFLAATAVVLFALTPTPTLGGSPQDASPAPAATGKKPTAEAMAKAKKVYAQDCALCHGENGSGQTDIGKSMNLSSDWTKPGTLADKSDDALTDTIRKGKGSMPPEGEARADNATVRAMIAYIRGFSKGAAAAAPAAK